MNGSSRVTLGWPVLVAGAVLLVATGAGIGYVAMRWVPAGASDAAPAPVSNASPAPGPAAASAPGAQPDVVVTLTPEAIQRAGIVVAPVTAGAATAVLRLPGIVEPNAYKQVVVTPLAGGRVTRVLVELGQSVRRGQSMAEIFSPELAEAETRFVSARAELDAHERELQRTQKLVEIGAASRQEVERLHAEHTAKLTAIESARARLELLGLSASAIDNLGPGKDMGAVTPVSAPIAGVVTERTANPGLNVDMAAKLFTVVDLSTVWVVADVYEKDFSRVRAGAAARVTTTAFPDAVFNGHVSYIDPQLNPETRTARVRVEVPNPRQDLRLGMFAEVGMEAGGSVGAVRVPNTAVQNVGDRTVVYVADPVQPGRFVEREVRLGDRVGQEVAVLSGVAAGDTIVTGGSFLVRAERERLGLRPAASSPAVTMTAPEPLSKESTPTVQAAKVVVTEQGYEPATLALRAGVLARITFVRTTDKTCGTEVVFPSLDIRRPLPLNQPVVVEFTPKKSGEIGFVCGMNMLHGTVAVQ
jgi:RND family efflux transporter MFP subunit